VSALLGVALLAGVTVVANVAIALCRLELITNDSASLPLGLYRAVALDRERLPRGAIVCLHGASASAPTALRAAIESGQLDEGWRREALLKTVVAVVGDLVTYEGDLVHVNGKPLKGSTAFAQDRDGAPLPHPSYPVRVQRGEVWVASEHPAGVDSRYFGVVSVSALSCRAEPWWTL
jgi:conjugative transfer signal peptidase TraF